MISQRFGPNSLSVPPTSAYNRITPMNNTKFVVKVNRGGILATQYVRRLDHSPIVMTTDRKLALLMGKLTAEDAISAIQNSRCTAELVSVQVRAGIARA